MEAGAGACLWRDRKSESGEGLFQLPTLALTSAQPLSLPQGLLTPALPLIPFLYLLLHQVPEGLGLTLVCKVQPRLAVLHMPGGSAAFQTPPTPFPSPPCTPTEAQGLGGHLHLQQRCGKRGWEHSRPAVSTAPVPTAAGQPGEGEHTGTEARPGWRASIFQIGSVVYTFGAPESDLDISSSELESWESRSQM